MRQFKIPQGLRLEFERESRAPGEMMVMSDATDYRALLNMNQTTNLANAVYVEQVWRYQVNDDVYDAITLAHPRWAQYAA